MYVTDRCLQISCDDGKKMIFFDDDLETAAIVFKSKSGLAPTDLSTLLTRNSTRDIVNSRNCETDLLAPRMKTSNGQKAFSFRGAKVWNGLKHEVKLAPSLSTFKCRLKCT